MATRQVNLSDVLGESAWGNKDWRGGFPSIIVTGFEGGGIAQLFAVAKIPRVFGSFLP